ncbi:hypothetical protein SEA1_gp0095 [Salmonella phage SEA1]|nr:hypothetical protein SEA1_gp0095 [Salmonella phage SEA1]
MSLKLELEVGDLLITRCYDGSERIEICQYKGQTGFLMYTIYDELLEDGICRSQLERFIKDTETLPHLAQIIHKSSSYVYAAKMSYIANKTNQIKQDKHK